MKYLIDWKHPIGKVTRTETHIVIHPADYVSQVFKQKGLDVACKTAVELVTKKYNQTPEKQKVTKH